MNLLEGLNPEQKAAVEHDLGPMLVVAGAGTGKTQVITRRIAYLIASGKAAPSEILALTFTEKAAREMSDRLHGLIGWEAFQVPVLTFNAFGAELLNRFAPHIGRSTRGGLINNIQKTLILMQHLEGVELEYYTVQDDLFSFLEGVVKYIEKLQNADISPEAYRSYVLRLNEDRGELHPADVAEHRDLSALYSLYEEAKSKTGTYDYHDQLAIPLRILRHRPNLAERLARQYKYVLVDEYQDTSPVQDALLRTFIPRDGNIFAVGDDDQGIYSFRGADIANILSFADHFQLVRPLALVQNYRSGQPVLDASYALICNNNPNRLESKLGIDKRLKAQHSDASVAFVPYLSKSDEQEGVLGAVCARLEGGESASSIAILSRSNAMLKTYAKLFRERGIPFAISTEVNIFEQRELIQLWYLLEWIASKAGHDSMVHVSMGPFLNLPPAVCRSYVARARDAGVSFEVAVEQAREEGDPQADSLLFRLETWRSWAMQLPVSQLAYRLVFETGLAERLMGEAQDNGRAVRVFEDLHRLLEQMQDFESVAIDPTLSGYLQIFPKPPVLEVSEAVGQNDGIQLLTVHASKGLEFETVYVVNCTQKSWSPQSARGLEIPAELAPEKESDPDHEQRRLMYVAATRAKRNLLLSAPLQTEGGQKQTVSWLIEELTGTVPPAPPKAEKVDDHEKMLRRLQRFYPLKSQEPESTLPFMDGDGWINLSVGALRAYDSCPYEFYLQYALGITQPFGPQLSFGTTIHGVIQCYFEARMRGERMSWAECEARFTELWSDRGYANSSLAEAARTMALESLKGFLAREDGLEREVLGCETKVSLEIPEAKLRVHGRIDAYFRTPDGIEIRDFKTGQKRDREKLCADAKDNFQLRTYALAYEAMNGVAPASVVLDYVVTGVEGQAQLTSRVLANHRKKLSVIAERIRARDFAPAALSDFHQCAAFRYYGQEDEADGA